MIVHPSRRENLGGEVRVSARIEFDTASARRKYPAELWFRFGAKGKEAPLPAVSGELDPFVVALLLPAMQLGEKIEVRGTISRKLWEGLQEYQRVFHSWFPERFHLVEIRAEGLREEARMSAGGVACAFSGGVDSFYTLFSLLGRVREEAAAPLTHTLFMAGFDMPLNLTSSIAELVGSYSVLMEELGLSFVVGSTNIRAFVNSVDWTNAHGQALAASALFFEEDWGGFFIPSSYTGDTYPKWGTHPELDPHLSTEKLGMIHHGTSANRLQKLRSIALEPASYERLRVCWIQDIGLRNCGECEKCLRTMAALEILGVLQKYATFSGVQGFRGRLRGLKHRTHQSRLFARELLGEAVARRKAKILMDIGYSLLCRELRQFLGRFSTPRAEQR